jgi:hypothetical protein
MVKTYTEATSGSKLISGIIGTVDVGSILANAINFTLDLSKAEEIFKLLQNGIEYLTGTSPSDAKTFATMDIETLINGSPKKLKAYLWAINEQMKSQVGASAGGFRATATLIGQNIKLMSQTGTIDLWTELSIGIPLQKTQDKAERYWNKTIAPYLPSDRDSFMLYRMGKWSKTDYINKLRENDGLKATDAENITDQREWQTGKSSLRDTYLMVQKGLQAKPYFINLVTKGWGFTSGDAEILYEHFSYDFSPSELLRLSDLVPLKSSWVEKKLKANGLDDEDRAIFKSAVEKRSIRDEVTRIWGLLLDNYQWGLNTETELRELLTNWKFSETEINLRVETGELIKLKLRVKLLRDAEIYLYRQGIITEDELLTRLVNLTIGKDVANCMVRYEAAKKGIEWEIPEP